MEDVVDDNLDDFFAKKDKSKKKGKTSKITPDAIEERLERKLKKGKSGSGGGKKEKERGDTTDGKTGGILDVNIVGDDGEWNEVEEETSKDYSGLRIQNFQLAAKEQEEKERQEAAQLEDGEESERRDGVLGPWKPVQTQVTVGPPIIPDPVVTREPEKEVPVATTLGGAVYIPLHRRNAARNGGSVSGVTVQGGGKRKKTAPDVMSQEDFPTLGGAASDTCYGGVQEYEKVRSGGRSMEDPANRIVKLSLGNKYDALQGENS